MIRQVIPSVLFFVNEEKVEVREGGGGEFEGPDIDAKAKGNIQKAPLKAIGPVYGFPIHNSEFARHTSHCIRP